MIPLVLTLALLSAKPEVVCIDGCCFTSRPGKRDPFRSPDPPCKVSCAPGVRLCAWTPDQLRLVGVVHKGNVRLAVLKAPTGEVAELRLGDVVGMWGSKLTAVRDSEAELTSVVKHADGSESRQVQVLHLNDAPRSQDGGAH